MISSIVFDFNVRVERAGVMVWGERIFGMFQNSGGLNFKTVREGSLTGVNRAYIARNTRK